MPLGHLTLHIGQNGMDLIVDTDKPSRLIRVTEEKEWGEHEMHLLV